MLGFFVSADVPRPISTLPDWRILVFTGGVTLATGILFGIAPAFQSSRTRIGATLKETVAAIAHWAERHMDSVLDAQRAYDGAAAGR